MMDIISENPARSVWNLVYGAAGGNHEILYIKGTWFIAFLPFAVMSICFGYLDIFGVPRILRQFKIQKTKNVPMKLEKFIQSAVVSTFNMTIVTLCGIVVVWYSVARFRMEFHPSRLPSFGRAICDLLLCVAINEITFYYIHRHVHWLHHSWTAPCAMATFYAHPLEHLLVNMGGLLLGPAIVGMHLGVAWIFWIVGVSSTILAHSGYHLPFIPSPQGHDFHHYKGRDQYGTIGVLDWLHSSNRYFKNSINYKRHFTIAWTPADQMVKQN